MKKLYSMLFLLFHGFLCADQTYTGDDLIRAALLSNIILLRSLAHEEVDLNYKNESGLTALMIAAYHGYTNFVRLLIERGVDVNMHNIDGNTALMYACSQDRDEIVKLLIDAGAQINIQNSGGWTALMHAISFGKHNDIVRFLCEHDADITIQDDEGNTSCMLAQECNRVDIVEYLRSIAVQK